MVRWFVKKQHVWLRQQQTAQCNTAALTTRKQRDIGRLLGACNLSDSAYDKTGKELFEKASRIKVIDTE